MQGSGVGPVMYVVDAADLQAVMPGNIMVKYADDTYLVIPACHIDSREREISNIEGWSCVSNLTLNQSKSAEIVFTDSRKRRLVQAPPPLQGIARATSLKVLGVTVTEKLSVAEHVDDVLKACARSMYAISVPRSHGMCTPLLQQVFQSVTHYLEAHLYAVPAWWGFSTSADRLRFET